MKIRNGFVSNSSSSSFLLIGKKYDSFEDIPMSEIKAGNVRMIRYSEESKLTEEYYRILDMYSVRDVDTVFNFYKEYHSGWGGEIILEEGIEAPAAVVFGDFSHHVSWAYHGLDKYMDDKLGLDVF